MAPRHPALARLAPGEGRLTLGLELPLDNDWGPSRQATDRTAGRPHGVPDLADHVRLARLADRLGFAGLWVRDVPLFDPVRFGDAGTVFETFTHLGHLAAVTERAVLGTAAVVLPLREPLLVAKAAATVDALSGGRMLLGLASGDRPVEYPLFGRDFEARGAAFREDCTPCAPPGVRARWNCPGPGSARTSGWRSCRNRSRRRASRSPSPAAPSRRPSGSPSTPTPRSTTHATWARCACGPASGANSPGRSRT
ncbi:LLM class flavin-dependent oxidoreductase [Streptomyces diastatochromogenes]|nr:LLM class flavin-dependent oxidoreductase [Streptomyces diastatochromogenes]